MKCDGKVCYATVSDALQVADEINSRRALMFAPVVVFWCDAHCAHHLGHNRKPFNTTANELVQAGAARVELRIRCAALAAAARSLEILAA